MPSRLALLAALVLAPPAAAQPAHGPHASHAAPQARKIAGLSAADLDQLSRGAGWGLARAAELNGVPGPTHLLDLAEEIGLDPEQRAAIAAIRDEMRRDAIAAGARFVAAERALDESFADGPPDAATLERLAAEAGAARTALRLVHLNAHRRAAALLSPAQTERYAVLRGYRGPSGTSPR